MGINLEANPVVDDHFWILTKNGEKVGMLRKVINTDNFVFQSKSTKVKINDINDLDIKFTPKTNKSPSSDIYGYPINVKHYNKSLYDVQKGVPMFTKRINSDCWYGAGYYGVKRPNLDWTILFCPKLITLQRYSYLGPFTNKNDASTFIQNVKIKKNHQILDK